MMLVSDANTFLLDRLTAIIKIVKVSSRIENGRDVVWCTSL